MTQMTPEERRSYMREALSFKVDFEIMTQENFDGLEAACMENISVLDGVKSEAPPADSAGEADIQSAELLKFLMHLDDKLDRVLALLSGKKREHRSIRQGIGRNISGSGMEIISDEPVESGRILHLKFCLAKYPLTFMDLLGRIVRVTPLAQQGRPAYSLGVTFVNMGENERETIINHVFRKQREALRQRNKQKQ